LEEKLSVDDYLAERVEKQDALFRKVPPMAGAVNLVKHLVRPYSASHVKSIKLSGAWKDSES